MSGTIPVPTNSVPSRLRAARHSQRAPAPEPAKEQVVRRGGPLLGKGDRRRESRVPIRANGVPVGIVVACFRPQRRGDELSIDTGRSLGGKQRGEHTEKRQRTE